MTVITEEIIGDIPYEPSSNMRKNKGATYKRTTGNKRESSTDDSKEFDRKINEVLLGIDNISKVVGNTLSALDKLSKEDRKDIQGLLDQLRVTQTISSKILDTNKSASSEEVEKLTRTLVGIDEFLKSNKRIEIEDKTLRQILRENEVSTGRENLATRNIDDTLDDISQSIGQSTLGFLRDNIDVIKDSRIKKDFVGSTLSKLDSILVSLDDLLSTDKVSGTIKDVGVVLVKKIGKLGSDLISQIKVLGASMLSKIEEVRLKDKSDKDDDKVFYNKIEKSNKKLLKSTNLDSEKSRDYEEFIVNNIKETNEIQEARDIATRKHRDELIGKIEKTSGGGAGGLFAAIFGAIGGYLSSKIGKAGIIGSILGAIGSALGFSLGKDKGQKGQRDSRGRSKSRFAGKVGVIGASLVSARDFLLGSFRKLGGAVGSLTGGVLKLGKSFLKFIPVTGVAALAITTFTTAYELTTQALNALPGKIRDTITGFGADVIGFVLNPIKTITDKIESTAERDRNSNIPRPSYLGADVGNFVTDSSRGTDNKIESTAERDRNSNIPRPSYLGADVGNFVTDSSRGTDNKIESTAERIPVIPEQTRSETQQVKREPEKRPLVSRSSTTRTTSKNLENMPMINDDLGFVLVNSGVL